MLNTYNKIGYSEKKIPVVSMKLTKTLYIYKKNLLVNIKKLKYTSTIFYNKFYSKI